MRGKNKQRSGPAPKPDLYTVSDAQVINTDIAFDENERKKFDALAEPFLSESVSNLPQTLEETINNYHNKNAESLVLNKSDLANAKETMSQILEQLCVSLKSAQVTRRKEQVVSEKLRSIDLNSDKDATVHANKQDAAKLLQQIYEDASVPTEWKELLEHPQFSNINKLPHLFEVLMLLTEEIRADNVPPSLVGLRAAKERIVNYKNLQNTFQLSFVTFFTSTFGNDIIAATFGKKNSKQVEYRHVEKQGEEPQKYSVTGVKDHDLLKCLNLFEDIIFWIKDNYPESYEKLQKSYINCACMYINKAIGSQFLEMVTKIHALERGKPLPTDPFSTDEEYTTGEAKLITMKIDEILVRFFKALRIEACVLSEFWGVTDPVELSSLISKTILEYTKALMEATKKYDPLYIMVAYRVCSSQESKQIVPVEKMLQIPRDEWNAYIKRQINDLKNMKPQKNKTVVLRVFKDVPHYIKALAHITPENDMTILERTVVIVFDELLYWLTDHVIAKFSKRSKRARMIILNLAYLTDALKEIKLLRKNAIISEKLDSIDKLLKENVDAFLSQMAATTWTEAFAFFSQINMWMKQEGFTYEMVTFQITHTEDKFKELNEKIDKKIATTVGECYSFMKKKIRDEDLRNDLRKSVALSVKELFQNWTDLSQKCYGIKLITTPEKVAQLMNDHHA